LRDRYRCRGWSAARRPMTRCSERGRKAKKTCHVLDSRSCEQHDGTLRIRPADLSVPVLMKVVAKE
jgi:hypothetical protein